MIFMLAGVPFSIAGLLVGNKYLALSLWLLPTLSYYVYVGPVMALIPGITMSELERIAILRTLDAVDGSTARAAEILGIKRTTLQSKMKKLGIQRPSR